MEKHITDPKQRLGIVKEGNKVIMGPNCRDPVCDKNVGDTGTDKA